MEKRSDVPALDQSSAPLALARAPVGWDQHCLHIASTGVALIDLEDRDASCGWYRSLDGKALFP
jgi:hypothetical protein